MKTWKSLIGITIAAAAILSIVNIGVSEEPAAATHHDAICILHPTKDNTAHGWVRFIHEDHKLKITAEVEGLAPGSTHGFHIHEFGDCSAPDASSAGGHFNPDHHEHGGPDAKMHHAGDLGNIKADDKGVARLELSVTDLSIHGEKDGILGRSIILHAKADDLKTQPSGDSGARIACGVIGLAKPK